MGLCFLCLKRKESQVKRKLCWNLFLFIWQEKEWLTGQHANVFLLYTLQRMDYRMYVVSAGTCLKYLMLLSCNYWKCDKNIKIHLVECFALALFSFPRKISWRIMKLKILPWPYKTKIKQKQHRILFSFFSGLTACFCYWIISANKIVELFHC